MTRHTVAHLITPYLFPTGSWIYSQLVHNQEFRPIVITQSVEHLDIFPFEPVYNVGLQSRGVARFGFLLEKYLYGSYPIVPYRRVLMQEPASILHAHLGWEGARTVALSQNPRLPFVVSFYGRDAGPLPKKLYWRLLYKRLFRLADRIVVEGSFMAATLEAIGAPVEKVRVVHLGISPPEFPLLERRAPAPSTSAPIVGLIAASLREKKGIAYALEALARVAPRHPNLHLHIIGDGPLRAQISARAAKPDLAGRVTLLGHQPYPVYREELKKAHFLMAPSVTALDGDSEGGAPVCLLEAQASGLPVIATTHCDIPEVTRPGVSALLAPERDAAALAERMEELLAHPERWPEMGRAGRAHVEAEFNIHTQVERMNEVYTELISD